AQSAVVATNLIQAGRSADGTFGGTRAEILGSSIETAGPVTVAADNASVIDATNSTASLTQGGSSAISLQIASNTIGYERGNLLFGTLETLIGDVVSDGASLADSDLALRQSSPVKVLARIADSTVTTPGAVVVIAVNSGSIRSQVDNQASAAVVAVLDAKASSIGLAVVGNKVAIGTEAVVEDAVIEAGPVTVEARGEASIDARSQLGSAASATNTLGANILNNVISALRDDYDFTDKSGTRSLKLGDIVRVEDAGGTPTYYK